MNKVFVVEDDDINIRMTENELYDFILMDIELP
jgi:hypothetical protein